MADLTLQPTAAPTRKVATGVAVGVPGAVIAVWIARQFGLDMDPEVAAAFGGIIAQTVSYITKERA